MRACWVAALCLSAGLVAGCGGAQKPKVAEPPPPPKATVAVAEPEPDLSPVETPPDVFFLARIVSLSSLVDTGAAWAGFPFDWRRLLQNELPGLQDVVAFDAPIDVAAMLDPAASIEPRALAAVSVGVRSVEDAAAFLREHGESVQKLPRGLYRVEVESGEICQLGPALGAAPGRIICSEDDAAVDALAPFMARGLPTESLGGSDVQLRLLAQPFRRRYGPQVTLLKTAGVPTVMKELGIDDPRLEAALKETLYGLAEELVDLVADLDHIALDLDLAEKEEHVDVSLAVAMAGTKSWTARTLKAASTEMITAPELFYSLPSDATSASFATSLPSDRLEPIADGLAALTNAGLAYLDVPKRYHQPLAGALKRAIAAETRAVGARFDLTDSRLVDYRDKAETDQARAALRHALGHYVTAVEGEGGAYQDLLAQLSKLVGDRSLRKRVEKLGVVDELPTVRRRYPRGGSGLPRGSYVYSISLPGSWFSAPALPSGKKGKAGHEKPFEIVLAVAPKGETTFFGLSADEDGLYALLKSWWLSGDEDRARLGEVAALSVFRQEHVLSGGLTTPRGIAEGSPLGNFMRVRRLYRNALEVSEALEAMPSGGMSPLVWASTIDPEGPTARMRMRVTKRALQEVAAGLMAEIGPMGL